MRADLARTLRSAVGAALGNVGLAAGVNGTGQGFPAVATEQRPVSPGSAFQISAFRISAFRISAFRISAFQIVDRRVGSEYKWMLITADTEV